MKSDNWSEVHLKDCIEIQVGFPFESKKYADSGIRLLGGNEIQQGRINWDTPRYWSKSNLDGLQNYFLAEGDIVLAMDRPWVPAGLKYSSVSFRDTPSLLVQRTARLRGKDKLDTSFLKYLIGDQRFTQYVKIINTGSLVPHISAKQIGDFKAIIPPLNIQKRISKTLGVIDQKIELNNRINAELEAMAKTLYDYWFVQFDFPNANGKPYKTSGGKMVYNPTLKREIPEGWSTVQLEEIIERSGTGLNPRDNFKLGAGSNYYVTIKNVTNGKIVLDDKCDKIDDEALKIIDRRSQLQPGDVLFTSIEPVGVTYLIQEKPSDWNINESVFTLRPNLSSVTPEYLYLLLSSMEMKAFTKNSSSGSVHKGIRHGVLKSFQLAHGGKTIVYKFSQIVDPMLKRIHALDSESSELVKLRDWLLPMLMNGQVTIG